MPRGAAIGIDLGTTYSCAAVWFLKKNRVEIIPNEQGNKSSPSFVAFDDTVFLVGEGAKNQIARNPTNTVFDVKRLIGRRFNDSQVQMDMESWPFKVVEGADKKPTVVVEFKGEEKNFAPEELSAMVLKKMKEAAEEYIGTVVTDAVITVPAYFDNRQREATKKAGSLAGLNVMRLLNEPTAAAIAYGVDKMTDKELAQGKNVFVFDLGGGTFDVSLLRIGKRGFIEVKAVGGDTHLGGEDFDMALVDYCICEFKKKHKKDMKGNPRALGRLKVACEKAKRDLSSTTSTMIEIDCLYNGIDFSFKLSRAKFEELNAPFFDTCIQLVKKCLSDGKTDKKDVDEVVLVGGSTRIPKLQRMLEEFFEGKALCKSLNGDEAVAYGASILASKLSGNHQDSTSDVGLLDITPLSLGIEVQSISGESGFMSFVIPKHTSVPTCIKKRYHLLDDKRDLRISVYEGENSKVRDNRFLGRFCLKVWSDIEVCFAMNVNGILVVSAEEISTGKKKAITISYS